PIRRPPSRDCRGRGRPDVPTLACRPPGQKLLRGSVPAGRRLLPPPIGISRNFATVEPPSPGLKRLTLSLICYAARPKRKRFPGWVLLYPAFSRSPLPAGSSFSKITRPRGAACDDPPIADCRRAPVNRRR